MAVPNKEYWAERFKILEAAQHERGGVFSEEVEEVYKRTMKEVERDIESWYARLAKNNGISMTEARKWLNNEELEEFKWDLEEYIKRGQENALNKTWMKELENASARVHISRLESLKIKIRQSFEMQYKIENQMMFDFLEGQYKEQYYGVAFDIAKGTNFGVFLDGVDSKKLAGILSKPWTVDKKTFSDRIWLKKEEFIGRLYQELTQSIARGKGPEYTVRLLHKEFSSTNSRYEIRRVVMTESAYFSANAQETVFKDLDVEQYQILATLDRKTSSICRELDGDVFDMKDYVIGATAPPFHPFCRTTTIPYFEPEDGDLRFVRDADGKGVYVPSNMKYDDWREKFIKE